MGECIAPGIRDSASLQAGAVGSGGFRPDGARGTQLALLRGVERGLLRRAFCRRCVTAGVGAEADHAFITPRTQARGETIGWMMPLVSESQ